MFHQMKFWIGDDPELSERVQKILFSMGYSWYSGDQYIEHTEVEALYTHENGNVTCCVVEDVFINRSANHEEINIDWMRTQDKETVELNGKQYYKHELEEALKHIKPIGE
jgi:hypothetical protein